jgi:hypothetical protein
MTPINFQYIQNIRKHEGKLKCFYESDFIWGNKFERNLISLEVKTNNKYKIKSLI